MENQILSNLQSKSLELRKQHNPLGLFLNAVISDAKGIAIGQTKDGVKVPLGDEHAVKAIKNALKQQDDVLDSVKSVESDKVTAVREEASHKKELLNQFLPAQPSPEDMEAEVRNAATGMDMSNPKKAIGPLMKILGEKYGAGLDRTKALEAINKVIASI